MKEPDLAGHGPDVGPQRHDQMPKRHGVEVSVGVIRYNDFAPGLYQTRVELPAFPLFRSCRTSRAPVEATR